MTRSRLVFWGLLVGMIVLDQATKVWARYAADFTERKTILALWPDVFELTLVYNRGIAFGLFQGAGVFLAPVAITIAIGAIWYNFKHPKDPMWGHVAASLLAAGALGNLYDRLVHGQVTDMFWIRAIDFPVFNIADACITVAAGLMILSWVRDAFKSSSRAQVHETPAPSAE